ncbi:MAG: ATPase domain-containing protein, partial [Candidatus Thermoplasmatota archaeon]
MRVRSGVEGFDALIDGGLPEGTAVILQGPPGTEKDTFAFQFLAEGLRAGEAAVIVVSSTSPEQFLDSLAKFGVDIETTIALNRLKIVDWHSYQEENVAGVEERGHIVRCSVDLTNVAIALSRALGTLAVNVPRRAVLEVLSRGLRIYDVDQVYAFAQSSKAKLSRHKVTAIFLLEKEMHDAATLSSVCQPFDGVIDIDRRREGDTIVRKIGGLSMKDPVPDSQFHIWDISAGKGLRVRATSPEPAAPASKGSGAKATPATEPSAGTSATPQPDRAALILRIAEERVRFDPTDADALFAKASALAAMGNLAEAIQTLDALINANDTYPGLWVLRAKLFAKLGDKQGAQESRLRAEGIAHREEQRIRTGETIACPICDVPGPVDAVDCPSCGARFVEEVGLAEELDRLGKAAIQERVREELTGETEPAKAAERKIVPGPADRVVKAKAPTPPPSPVQGRRGMTNGVARDALRGPAGRTNGLTNG